MHKEHAMIGRQARSGGLRAALIILGALLVLWATGPLGPERTEAESGGHIPERPRFAEFREHLDSLYVDIGLRGNLDYPVFELAMIGYYNMLADSILGRESVVTIIDYTLPSTEERLVVIDLESRELLYKSLVAHGRNTGANYAEEFSNTPGSLQSSLGFYVTGDDYYGMHGKSLELNGVDTLYNEQADLRNIVVHGAWYCSDEFIERHGRLGRSWGCPALPLEVSEEIIDAICDGTCMFVYADDDEYLENSIYLEIDGAADEFRARRNRR